LINAQGGAAGDLPSLDGVPVEELAIRDWASSWSGSKAPLWIDFFQTASLSSGFCRP
jgi:hypothetical protein